MTQVSSVPGRSAPRSVDSGQHDPQADACRLWLQLAENEERRRALQARLEQIGNSRSWRLTGWLRAAYAMLAGRAVSRRPALQAASTSGGDAAHWPAVFRTAVPGLVLPQGFGGAEGGRRCLLDVTELALEDLGGGVQRVTRRWLSELLAAPPEGFLVEPVRLSSDGGYALARQFLARFLGMPEGGLGEDVLLQPRSGDLFIGLDFCRDRAVALDVALGQLKSAGASVVLVLPDMLPALRPEWFPAGIAASFGAWIEVCARRADRVICISRDSAELLASRLGAVASTPVAEIAVVPLGADLPLAVAGPVPWRPSDGVRLLMVGTLEPRKGHAQALDAFEDLLAQGRNVELLLVGRRGWADDALFRRLHDHPQRGARLNWLEDADDGVLAAAYRDSDLLLMASHGEGYGLPIGEAARAGCGLLLRDIPVFREVGGNAASYFSGNRGTDLAVAIGDWLDRPDQRPDPAAKHWATWEKSASILKNETIRA